MNELHGDERAWIELNFSHLAHNVTVLQEAMPHTCELMAVVKAQGYGHGAAQISSYLNALGVRAFAVATLDEGISLRRHGILGDILILGYTSVHCAYELSQYDLTQTLIDADYAKALDLQNIPVKAHIKLDTGMHRLGFPSEEISAVKSLFSLRNLHITGIYTHLCCAESLSEADTSFTEKQIGAFYACIGALKRDGIAIPKLHIQSSYGLLNYPGLSCDYVRAGIALYGCKSAPDDSDRLSLDLRPVLALKARIVHIQTIPQGESAGYDRAFTAARESRLAILSIGYGDGVPRALSGGAGKVRIRGRLFPTAGRICMDQLAVDITGAPDIALGDTATLIGNQENDPLNAARVAADSGSIANELLCRLGTRLPIIESSTEPLPVTAVAAR